MALASSDTIAPPAPAASTREALAGPQEALAGPPQDGLAGPGEALAGPPREALAALDGVRKRTFALIAHLGDDDLRRSHSPIMSPLVWDLAHIAAYEDLWLCARYGGLPLLRPDLAEMYDAFETPRAVRAEIELLGPQAARQYLRDVRAHTATVIAEGGVGDGTVYELVLRHELQHTETMLQTLALAGLLPPDDALAAAGLQPLDRIDDPARRDGGYEQPEDARHDDSRTGHEDAPAWIDVPAGPFAMGAGEEGFAYDNERPRHSVEVPAFQIAHKPVSNAEWAAVTGQAREGHPKAPVCHVNWLEAEAFAEAAGARLPSEAEWEKAAKLGALEDVGRVPEKAAKLGLLEGVGRVWEWTSSRFGGYPDFRAHPYREYSEVFFGGDYRVLRGGSWATDKRVGTLTFRNWDLPVRGQIFAGVRLAREPA